MIRDKRKETKSGKKKPKGYIRKHPIPSILHSKDTSFWTEPLREHSIEIKKKKSKKSKKLPFLGINLSKDLSFYTEPLHKHDIKGKHCR